MSYDTFGNLKVLLVADFDGDGTVTYGDMSAFLTAYAAEDPSADMNGNGEVSEKDLDPFVDAYYGTTGLRAPDEVRIGYGGYVRDRITGKLLARQRWYEPLAGRWISRDPAGYVDGLDLYLYVRGNPLSLIDPMGLAGDDPAERAANSWDGLRSLAEFNPFGIVTHIKRWRMEDALARQARNAGIQDACTMKAADSQAAYARAQSEDFGNRSKEIAQGLDTAVRVAAPGGDSADSVANFVRKPSWTGAAAIGLGVVTTATVLHMTKNAPVGAAERAAMAAEAKARAQFRNDLEGILKRPLGADERAHHLVAMTAEKAAPARERMKELGLDVNDARINGSAVQMDLHGQLHTDAYYRHVNRGLETAKNAKAGRSFLQGVDKAIQNAKSVEDLPWEKNLRDRK
jgi:RHS repeat-associated protein